MKRRGFATILIAALVLSLTGCLRYNSIYYIHSDGTVSGQIYTAIKEGYQTESDPYKGTGAGEIAALYPGATITDETAAPWYAYRVSFSDAPLASFASAPTDPWDAQITKASNVFTVVGYNTDATTAETRNTITTEGGYSYLQVGFPGELKDGGNASSSGTSDGAGWAEWNLLTMSGSPHAEGYDGFLFFFPGVYDFFPLEPTVGPAATTAPAPVVTVVITPSAAASPSPSASSSAAPSPTLTTIAAPSTDESGGGIPVWVWIVLAALVVALAGLGGYMLSRRGRGAPADVAADEASGDVAKPAAVKPAAAKPAAGETADTVVMEAVDPTPAPKPKKLPPDIV